VRRRRDLARVEESGAEREERGDDRQTRLPHARIVAGHQHAHEEFIVRRAGMYATPLLAVLVLIETTDLLLAIDSIPAVLAISLKPFIVYTSNVFAVLGLRSMYFVLAGMMDLFRYLHHGLALVLIFVGAKMLASGFYEIPTALTLAVVAGVLLASITASLLHPRSQMH